MFIESVSLSRYETVAKSEVHLEPNPPAGIDTVSQSTAGSREQPVTKAQMNDMYILSINTTALKTFKPFISYEASLFFILQVRPLTLKAEVSQAEIQ